MSDFSDINCSFDRFHQPVMNISAFKTRWDQNIPTYTSQQTLNAHM